MSTSIVRPAARSIARFYPTTHAQETSLLRSSPQLPVDGPTCGTIQRRSRSTSRWVRQCAPLPGSLHSDSARGTSHAGGYTKTPKDKSSLRSKERLPEAYVSARVARVAPSPQPTRTSRQRCHGARSTRRDSALLRSGAAGSLAAASPLTRTGEAIRESMRQACRRSERGRVRNDGRCRRAVVARPCRLSARARRRP